MNLISRVIALEWIKALFGAIVVLFLLVSVGDIVNGFLRNYSASRVLIEYFLKLPELTSKMLPISALLASLFAINKMKSHAELMAILAGGYSAPFIYRLILLCSLVVAFIQFVNLGFVIPKANQIKRQEFEKSRKNESKYLARSKIGEGGLIWYKTNDYFTSFKAFDRKNRTLKGVTIYQIDESHKLQQIYTADSAKFVAGKEWQLQNIKHISQLSEANFSLPEKFANLNLELQEEPKDFGQFESDITTLNIFELKSFISRLQSTDINSTEYEIMFFEKISLIFICIVFSLFPLSSIFTPNRRAAGFGKNVLLTLLFTIFFWGIHSSTISMGNNEKLPVLAATLGIPTLFSMVIMAAFLKNKQL